MATAVQDHQPQLRPRMGRVTSREAPAADELDRSKEDPESGIPSPDNETQTPLAPAATSPIQRIPTYLQPRLPWRDRLLHFTFAWYTVTMSTSGIALTLAATPHRFPGLSHIGLAIFLLDLLFFLLISLALVLRFTLHGLPTAIRAATHPSEALFIPTLFLSLCTILSNVDEYARLFLSVEQVAVLEAGFMRVMFWVYLAVCFAVAVGQYHLLFTVEEGRRLRVSAMTPAWILPIFPVMLAGSLAGTCVRGVTGTEALGVLCAGLAAQGLGFLVSVFMYATYLSRLMAFGLPVQRPGMFIAVGPPSFTCAALVGLAAEVPRVLGEVVTEKGAGEVWVLAGLVGVNVQTVAAGVRLIALCAAVSVWGLSFWFFASATVAVVVGMPDRRFHLSWWSFVFPNVGFTLASIRLGTALGSEGMLWFSSVMTALLFMAWLFIGFRCIRAVHRREIVWPGHDEDSD